jgi:hypothetical protein
MNSSPDLSGERQLPVPTYAYIDGAFLRDRSAAAMQTVFGIDPELDFNFVRSGLRAARLFYYDCVEDAPRQGEAPREFTARTAAQRDLIARVHEAPMSHVRLTIPKKMLSVGMRDVGVVPLYEIPEVIWPVFRGPAERNVFSVTKAKNKYSASISLINRYFVRLTSRLPPSTRPNHLLPSRCKSQSHLSCTDR